MDNTEYKSKLGGRIQSLLKRHTYYLNRKFESESDLGTFAEGVFLIEDELCFLLSFLTNQEIQYFHRFTNIQWTDEVEFVNDRPQIKHR